MRAVLALMLVPLVGCSTLLGIQDPSGGSGSGTDGGIDAGIDAMVPPSGDFLKISLANFSLAMKQRVRFHVLLMHSDGRPVEDISKSPMLQLVTSLPGKATIGPLTAGAVTVDGVATGPVTITARYNDAALTTVDVMVTAATCHPVINEFQTALSATAQDDEWVELYNPCTMTISVVGWSLNYRGAGMSGATGPDVPMVNLDDVLLDQHQLIAGQLVLLTSPSSSLATQADGTWGVNTGILAAGAGSIGLRSGPVTTGPLVDAVAYGSVNAGDPFIETIAAPPMSPGISAVRLPFDGNDSDNGMADFKTAQTTTPKALNVP